MGNAIPLALYKKLLNLIILPTEKCNFRCTYCYEDFKVGKMKPVTVQAIKRLIKARVEQDTLEALTLSWFGGEPLLARDVMLDIGGFANDLVEHGLLKQLHGDVTTNGYLLKPDLLRELVARRQASYQISLDGYQDGHNATRRYASGKGTFDVIWVNLLAARDTKLEFHITLRCHLKRDNEDSMEELVRHICAEFGGDRRFSVFFKPIENLGGPNAGSIKVMDRQIARERVNRLEQQLKAAGLACSAVIEGAESDTGRKPVVGPGTKMSELERASGNGAGEKQVFAYDGYICYAAKPNSLMIRADGTIGKCTVLLDDPRNKVGRINPDGTVTLDSELIGKLWMRGFVSRKPKELGCPALGLPKMEIRQEVPITFISNVAVGKRVEALPSRVSKPAKAQVPTHETAA